MIEAVSRQSAIVSSIPFAPYYNSVGLGTVSSWPWRHWVGNYNKSIYIIIIIYTYTKSIIIYNTVVQGIN